MPDIGNVFDDANKGFAAGETIAPFLAMIPGVGPALAAIAPEVGAAIAVFVDVVQFIQGNPKARMDPDVKQKVWVAIAKLAEALPGLATVAELDSVSVIGDRINEVLRAAINVPNLHPADVAEIEDMSSHLAFVEAQAQQRAAAIRASSPRLLNPAAALAIVRPLSPGDGARVLMSWRSTLDAVRSGSKAQSVRVHLLEQLSAAGNVRASNDLATYAAAAVLDDASWHAVNLLAQGSRS